MPHNPAHDALRFAVTDFVWDRIEAEGVELSDDFWDWYVDNIEEPVRALICEVDGHEPVQDMCNNPEHDYCAICNTSTPNQAVRRFKLLTNPDQ